MPPNTKFATTIVLTMNGCNGQNHKDGSDSVSIITSETDYLSDDDITAIITDITSNADVTTKDAETTGVDEITTKYDEVTTSKDEVTTKAEQTNKVEETTGIGETTKVPDKTSKVDEVTTKVDEVTTKIPETTTKEPDTTTEPEPPKEPEETAEKLTAENINNPEAFLQMRNDFVISPTLDWIDNGAIILFTYSYYYNGEQYKTYGSEEFATIMALLNYNYISNESMQYHFGQWDEDTFYRCGYFMNVLANFIIDREVTYDFEKYVINPRIAKFLNEYQHKALEAKKGNCEPFFELFYKYAEDYAPLKDENDPLYPVNYLVFSMADALGKYVTDTEYIEYADLCASVDSDMYRLFMQEVYGEMNSKTRVYER